MIDVLLVDDHPLLQLGLEARLSTCGLSVAIGDITDREHLLEQVSELRPIAVVLDHGLPSLGDGLSLIGPVTSLGCRVMMLTGTVDDALWGACLAAGAHAVVGKAEPLADITYAIEAIVADTPVRSGTRAAFIDAHRRSCSEREGRLAPFAELTGRERVVMGHLAHGRSPALIAEQEFVSIDTVRSQIKSILRKLEVSSQLEAVAKANQAGWTVPV